jgi:trehalose synthase
MSGVMTAFGEAVRHLLDEPPYATQLGKNARARAQAEFLGDRHLEQWAQLFAQLEPNKR